MMIWRAQLSLSTQVYQRDLCANPVFSMADLTLPDFSPDLALTVASARWPLDEAGRQGIAGMPRPSSIGSASLPGLRGIGSLHLVTVCRTS